MITVLQKLIETTAHTEFTNIDIAEKNTQRKLILAAKNRILDRLVKKQPFEKAI